MKTPHPPAGLDCRRTHLAAALHTQRLAFAVIATAGLLLDLLLFLLLCRV